jgi:hypothetical protein
MPRANSGVMTLGAIIPLCKTSPTCPATTFWKLLGSASKPLGACMSPRQFGPPTGLAVRLAHAARSAWRRAPSSPLSAKPLVIISSAPTPFCSHCSSSAGTPRQGTPTTTRSIGQGTSSTLG